MPTVLVIEDTKPLRDLMELLLQMDGYHVITEERGDRGWQRILAARPDIVLCDETLPGINGREILARLRADPALTHLPFMILSGHALYAPQADAVLDKPFDPTHMLDTVRRLLQRSVAG